MTRLQAEAAVIGVIAKIQEMSGRECPKITGKTIPIGDVPGFDSFNALEAKEEVAARLRMDSPGDANIFINEAGDAALSVREIAGRLMGIAETSEGITHAK